MDWLQDFTDWLVEQWMALWEAFIELARDFIVWLIEAVLDLAATIVESIPVPDFLSSYSICGLLDAAGTTTGWVMQTFRIGEGLTLLAAGFAFRMLRKLLTLFQW